MGLILNYDLRLFDLYDIQPHENLKKVDQFFTRFLEENASYLSILFQKAREQAFRSQEQ